LATGLALLTPRAVFIRTAQVHAPVYIFLVVHPILIVAMARGQIVGSFIILNGIINALK
jgi:hypothetical protein